jgi:hypothetical protein
MTTEDINKLARRRAGVKMGWYIHAFVYVAVNIALGVISATVGRNWAVFPALGWGLGLLIHGAVVFASTTGWRERLVERERIALTRQLNQPNQMKRSAASDPW